MPKKPAKFYNYYNHSFKAQENIIEDKKLEMFS